MEFFNTINDKRTDNTRAAVGPFCEQVRTKLTALGSKPRVIPPRLRELAVTFECCDWITDLPARVKEKGRVVTEMVFFCSSRDVNKSALLEARSPGLITALAAAIIAKPESGDDKILLKVRPQTVLRGVGQHTAVDAITLLDDKNKISTAEREALIRWAEAFHDPDPSLGPKIAALSARDPYFSAVGRCL